MGGVVGGLEKVMQSMDLEKVSSSLSIHYHTTYIHTMRVCVCVHRMVV